MKYAWSDDRDTMPVLVVGRTYRAKRGKPRTVIDRRRRTSQSPGYPHGSHLYAWTEDGKIQGEQNDFAFLNNLRQEDVLSDPQPGEQLAFFTAD